MDKTAWGKYAGKAATSSTTATTTNGSKTTTTTEQKPAEAKTEPASGQVETNGKNGGSTTPEAPESTDKGLTSKEWDKIIEKAQKTVELSENTAKKYGVTIPMSNKVYDALKVVVAIVLPLISTLYIGLANIWGFGFGEQVDKTIQLVIAAINALLGMAIVKSSSDYHKGS
jgi:hypothetical protein